MQDMNDLGLDTMTLRELLELQEAIHTAIRAQIRLRAERKTASSTQQAAPQRPRAIDLERERDAWLARRRSGSSAG